MPNRNGTGPTGKGPRTGRGMGNCESKEKPAADRPQPGRGTGRGLGRTK